MAILVALIRGLRWAHDADDWQFLGRFNTRSTLYILLPLSIVLAVFLVSQEIVVQTFSTYRNRKGY